MRYSEILALAMGNVAAAQFTTTRFANTTTAAFETATATSGTATIGTETTGTETSAASTSTAAGGIGSPDGFNFLGCFSGDGFPGFSLAYSSADNDADLCAESCLGSSFFGLNDASCYCGNELDLSTSTSVSTDQCDIVCPGDDSENCGGLTSGSRIMRRQAIDINVLLSIYVAIGVNPGGETETVVNTDFVTETLAPVTTTATVTYTQSGETATKTVTTVLAAVPTDVIIVCYGNYCAPQTHCPSCTKFQVVCDDGLCAPQECHDDTWNKLKICESGSCYYADYKEEECNQRIVCHGSSCEREISEDYARKFVCDVDEDRYYFDECHDDCYGYEKCSNGNCEAVHPPVTPPKPVSPPKPIVPGKPPVVVVPEPKPEHPTVPGMPETPSKPVKPETPMKPETPSKPEQSMNPEQPAKPQQPGTPAQSGKPQNPEVPVVTAGATKTVVGFAAAFAGFVFAL
ncbi:related to cornifin B [Fusarium torulosum]|uniref:Related to cornifin B n=1 Tax=Fusarium torulosum TaxID=33205 RepID=A0AAE8M1W0_9HYPO|nr:related to cornifin B [Fusarium torulosum]